MPRFLTSWLLTLAANAIALLAAWALLDGFHLSFPMGFVVAVVAFGVLNGLLGWAVAKGLHGRADRLLPATGLISTLLALVVTTHIGDSLAIEGLGTWATATVLIWLITMLIWVIPGPWRASTRPHRSNGR